LGAGANVYLQPPVFSVPLITSDDDVRPRIAVTIDGQRFTALLDTGAEQTVMSANAAFRLGIVSDGAGGTKMVHGIGPRAVPASMHVVRSIAIGDLTLLNRPVMVLGESFGLRDDVLLGADIQRLLHFWISNSARTLIMQFPAQASPPVR
jgi:predicted aspartyl protease